MHVSLRRVCLSLSATPDSNPARSGPQSDAVVTGEDKCFQGFEVWRWNAFHLAGLTNDADFSSSAGVDMFDPVYCEAHLAPQGSATLPALRCATGTRISVVENGVCYLPITVPANDDPPRSYFDARVNRGPCEPVARAGTVVLCVKTPFEMQDTTRGVEPGSLFGVVHATTSAGRCQRRATKARAHPSGCTVGSDVHWQH